MTADGPEASGRPPRRRYDSPLRRRRAADTRAAILEAAAQAFVERGYGGATLNDIAATAGVSADTVRLVGGKPHLLLEAFRRRYAGEGGWQSLAERPEVQRIFEIDDPDEAIAATAEFLVEGHSRSAQLWLVIRATAMTDDQVAAEVAELCRHKEDSFRDTARWLLRVGVLPPLDASPAPGAEPDDVPRELVVEVNVLMSAETFVVLTSDYGYSLDDYRAWIVRSLRGLRP